MKIRPGDQIRAKARRYTADELLDAMIADLRIDIEFERRHGRDTRSLEADLEAAKARLGDDPRRIMQFHHNVTFRRPCGAPVTSYDVQRGG